MNDTIIYLCYFRFDTILGQYPALEKVKTVGDCYMVVGGTLEQNSDHAQQV